MANMNCCAQLFCHHESIKMEIRTATYTDLDRIYAIECASFPQKEAATYSSLSRRLQVHPDQYWVLETTDSMEPNNKVILGFIGGMRTNHPKILDEMFNNAALHDPNGKWLAVLGLAVAPVYRQKGYASRLLGETILQTKAVGAAGITLTCKNDLVAFYQRFGFKDAGISGSNHGGVTWHDMILAL